jgi:hypothetical protein
MPDDDDRPRDASSAADGGWADDGLAVDWHNAVAPDDIRELTADIKAYHREQRAIRREWVLRRLTVRLGMRPLSLVAIILVLVAAIATMVAVVMPSSTRAVATAPLAKTTASPTRNGLLPQVQLRTIDQKVVASRSLRPSLIALPPSPCDCASLLRQAAADADAHHVQFVVVAPASSDTELLALSGTFGKVRSSLLYDATAALRHGALHAVGLTLVVVDPDGTVRKVAPSVTASSLSEINQPLQQLVAGAESSG